LYSLLFSFTSFFRCSAMTLQLSLELGNNATVKGEI
jgi:hypothetical protein